MRGMLKNTSEFEAWAEAQTRKSAGPARATSRFDYVISGLTVQSDVEIPSAIRAVEHTEVHEVTIRESALPLELPSPAQSGPGWSIEGDVFLLKVPRVARFLIRGGVEILFESEPGHDPGDVTLYLLGTCFAVLLQQRGSIVLHASAVSVKGKAMLFCGQSGAGKSTMAAMLCERGYPLLNDDVCSLRSNSAGGYSVMPDGRMLKLWAPSVEHLELEARRGPAVRSDTEKFYMAPPVSELEAQGVGGVYLLEAAEPGEAPSLRRLPLAEAMLELKLNSYRPALVQAMGMEGAYFKATAALQNEASLYVLRRPKEFESAAATMQLLETHWAQLGTL